MSKVIDRISKVVNPSDNGGESVTLAVEFHTHDLHDDEIDEVFTTCSVSLQSYASSSTINFYGLTPEFLRKFADELALKIAKYKADK